MFDYILSTDLFIFLCPNTESTECEKIASFIHSEVFLEVNATVEN
jgi:hypothetical protein